MAKAAPVEGEFCLTEKVDNKITFFRCPISVAVWFYVLFNIVDPVLHQDPALLRCSFFSKCSLYHLRVT